MKKIFDVFVLRFVLLLSIGLMAGNIFAQDFYDVNRVRDVKIKFNTDDWSGVLDSLKRNGDQRLIAAVQIDGVTYDSVGVRYKGNSSYFNVWKHKSTKLPFNIKAHHVKKKQRFPGDVKTIKLSNVFRDPSFLREVLSYEIAGDYMASPKANFARVYVNDQYLGLYNNTESVNKEFLKENFGNSKGAFFKCDPIWTNQVPKGCSSGDKAALLYQGKDTVCFEKNYELKSKNGWEELQKLTEILNKSPKQIEKYLNVDEVLWMLAFNNVLVNLDSYTGRLCHNYYLYQDTFGIFHPIVWDMNLSFGGFRFIGESKSLNNEELQTMSPFIHYKYEKRPLINKLLNIDLYRKVYVAHMKTILEEQFISNNYHTRGRQVQSIIDSYVRQDENKLYSYDAFRQNFDQTSDANNNKIIGIAELMKARMEYLKTHPIMKKEAPKISQVRHQKEAGQIQISARVEGATEVWLAYRCHDFEPFTKVKMKDDGKSNDGASGDETFGVSLNPSKTLQYYFIAENEKVASLSPARAAYEFHEMK